MNVIALINLLCSDYASPSHNGNGSNNDDAKGSNNDDAVGKGDGLGLSASNSFVEADDDESVGSVFEFIAHPNGDDDSTTDVENFDNDPTNDSISTPFVFAADPNFNDQSECSDDGLVGDSSSGDSMGNNENMPLVDHDTTAAFKIVTSHPMRVKQRFTLRQSCCLFKLVSRIISCSCLSFVTASIKTHANFYVVIVFRH
jgi:hypothetical protein